MDLLALLLGAAVAIILALAVLQKALGGDSAQGNQRVASILARLPRPLRDETFYEQLQPDGRTLGIAALLVALVGAAVMLPQAWPDLASGRIAGGLERLAGGAIGGWIVWIALSTVAFLAARLAFGARPHWRKLLAGLGYALSP